VSEAPSPIFFEGAVVSRRLEGGVSIALYDGALEGREPTGPVAVLECTELTARSLARDLGSITETAVR